LHVAVLGIPAVVATGRAPAYPPIGHARLAFVLLVLERHRAVHRDELADAIWNGDVPRTWWSALRTTLGRIRATLRAAGMSPDTLVAESGCYWLRLPPQATVDIEVARQSLARATALVAGGGSRAANWAAGLAEQATGTLVQPLLPGTDAEWVERARLPVARDAVRALELLSTCRAEAGDFAGAIAAAEAVIDRDPFRESAHLRKMTAHIALGDRVGALLAYRQCRDVLVSELGIEPSHELERMAQRAAADRRAAEG
jgi:DNA-binding SARP family transcriptional activator